MNVLGQICCSSLLHVCQSQGVMETKGICNFFVEVHVNDYYLSPTTRFES